MPPYELLTVDSHRRSHLSAHRVKRPANAGAVVTRRRLMLTGNRLTILALATTTLSSEPRSAQIGPGAMRQIRVP
jgi:hypothetical protein